MIYLVGADSFGPIKIGYSLSPEKRLKALQGSCPVHVACYALGKLKWIDTSLIMPSDQRTIYRFLERTIHKIFDPYRLYGEWFQVSILDILIVVESNFLPAMEAVGRGLNHPTIQRLSDCYHPTYNISEMEWKLTG